MCEFRNFLLVYLPYRGIIGERETERETGNNCIKETRFLHIWRECANLSCHHNPAGLKTGSANVFLFLEKIIISLFFNYALSICIAFMLFTALNTYILYTESILFSGYLIHSVFLHNLPTPLCT